MEEEIIEAQVYTTTPLSAQEVLLSTAMQNFTPKLLIKLDMHFWAGRSLTAVSKFPSSSVAFTFQRGTLPAGVKYGLCYADGEDSTARKWVVTFDSQAQKAYTEAGPTGPVDWNVVEVKLDRYATNKSEVIDPILGGKCSVEINGNHAVALFS